MSRYLFEFLTPFIRTTKILNNERTTKHKNNENSELLKKSFMENFIFYAVEEPIEQILCRDQNQDVS